MMPSRLAAEMLTKLTLLPGRSGNGNLWRAMANEDMIKSGSVGAEKERSRWFSVVNRKVAP